MRNNETGLHPALEAALKAATGPLDAQAFFDMPAIKESASTVGRVSDYLGVLWRRGDVIRTPAPKIKGSRSRWVYKWKGQKGAKIYGTEYVPKILADRPTMLITEEGGTVTLEFPNLIIMIKQKPCKN